MSTDGLEDQRDGTYLKARATSETPSYNNIFFYQLVWHTCAQIKFPVKFKINSYIYIYKLCIILFGWNLQQLLNFCITTCYRVVIKNIGRGFLVHTFFIRNFFILFRRFNKDAFMSC